MGRARYGAEGHRWEKFKRLVFATYGDVCVVCGHGGARDVDHVIPLTENPSLVFSLQNCRPIHGTKSRCPVCFEACNSVKAGMSLERARRITSERAGKPKPPTAAKTRVPPKQEKPQDSGREWLTGDQDHQAVIGSHRKCRDNGNRGQVPVCQVYVQVFVSRYRLDHGDEIRGRHVGTGVSASLIAAQKCQARLATTTGASQ